VVLSLSPPTRNPQMCSAIPKGRVTTYGDMAKALSPPSCARAVGQAMRRNPFAPKVPCHRVVASDLKLGGFKGSWVRCPSPIPCALQCCRYAASRGAATEADVLCA
jgi:O-6-methylguanine DNA methyltransferase